MPIDALLFLQRSDITHHVSARRATGAMPMIFIDPGLAEEALRLGLDPEHFSYRPLEVGPGFHARAATEAATRAAAVDQALTRERERLFGAGLLQGWDRELLRAFFMRALVARALGELCDRTFPEVAIGLYRPRNPQLFYFDAFLATDAFMAGSARWQVAGEYDGAALWQPDHAAHCFDFAQIAQLAAAGGAQAITHLPTCYAHHGPFTTQVMEHFAASIDLPSPFWDIPVRRGAPLLRRIDTLPAGAVSERALRYREVAARVFDAHLAPLLGGRDALHLQSSTLADRAFMQAIDYEGLLGALQGHCPHFVVSDHDTGHNGPLFSVAAALGAPITVLPHASTPTFTLPHAHNVTMIERDGFATPTRATWGEPVATRPVRLGPVPTPRPRSRVRQVCLFMNTLNGQGLVHVDLAGAARLHAALKALCAQHGAELTVRLKPNGAVAALASMAFGIAADELQAAMALPLAELAANTDLCIGHGLPSTGTWDFLAAGCYLLQASAQGWPADYLYAPAFVNDGSVPALDPEAALAHTAALLADPALFTRVADTQRLQFERRLTGASDRIFDTR